MVSVKPPPGVGGGGEELGARQVKAERWRQRKKGKGLRAKRNEAKTRKEPK